jgi:hypothetical protein
MQRGEGAAALPQDEVDADLVGRLLAQVQDQGLEGAGTVLGEHLDGEGHPGTSSKLGIIGRV